MIAKPHQWPLSAVAAAVLLGAWSGQACALSLGRIHVLSALGEPLKAEIDILDINADETASLSTKVASPDTFKTAGLEYSSIMASVRTQLSRRPDGRAYIQLSSNQRINDPFVDLIIETRWSSGRIVRDYTLLFDPPKVNAAATSSSPVTLPANQAAAATATTATPPVVSAAKPAGSGKVLAQASAASTNPVPASPTSLTVKAGDTASRIAAINKAPNLSLDQMLVALLRANPQAFIQQNVNWIKAGATISIPTSQQAANIAPEEARQIIMAQSRDFNSYRRSLAENVPSTEVAPAERSAVGKLEASVSDKKTPTPAPDKLTLSKATVQGKSNEEQLAQAGNAREVAQRADELTRNINELDKLASASQASAAASAASANAASAPKPAVIAPKVVPPPVAPEPSFVDDLLDNPMLPIGAASLVVLLAGLGWFRLRQRKAATQVGSEFAGDRLQPESFFGVSEVKDVDVRDNPPTGSSMLYSPSQLDAVDDFDPVAEAAVYMAYGRDQQAEDILKEALNDTPERITIHRKLLEIYAKRHDAKAFESTAMLVSGLTQASGAEWDSICALGRTVDPGNPLYQARSAAADSPNISETPAYPEFASATQAMPLEPMAPPATSSTSVDLDLDFDMPAEPPSLPQHLDPVDFAPTDRSELTSSPPASATPAIDDLAASLDFSLPLMSPAPETPDAQHAAAEGTPPPATDTSMLDFDLGDLSLELTAPPEPPVDTPAIAAQPDSLESKLALAEEYRAIGDEEAARALIQEVISAAADDVKTKAQRALNQL